VVVDDTQDLRLSVRDENVQIDVELAGHRHRDQCTGSDAKRDPEK